MYRTAEFLPNRKSATIYKAVDAILNKYNKQDYMIQKISTDEEFKPLLEHLREDPNLKIEMHFAAAQEHVPQAERSHEFIKERIRGMYHSVPFKALPRLLLRLLVVEVVKRLNFTI